jgi:pyruvate, orthophosphate dikinase
LYLKFLLFMETLLEIRKNIYTFGAGKADGNKEMKSLLGGKGANLAEMALIGLPVPPGFTITTEMCLKYREVGAKGIIKILENEVKEGVGYIQSIMETQFGSSDNPCLVSVRSGARASMPGMMDTVLNIGLNDASVKGLARKTGKEHFAWDSYRRLIQMYANVVMKVHENAEDGVNYFEELIDKVKEHRGVKTDQELTVEELKELVSQFKNKIKELTGKEFPQDQWEQLWNAIIAVFESWFTPRAVFYRQMHDIPSNWGTAVNVQGMVYGNMGETSASGVAFTRDAATGENIFNGEYLNDAQGEDVVAGIRTPLQITLEGSQRWAKLAGITEEERKKNYPSLEESMPEVYLELNEIEHLLEDHYRDMQDLEFTIQEGRLWILQTRNGKRTGAAMVRIGMEMFRRNIINEQELLLRMEPNKLNELLHPVFDERALTQAKLVVRGLPASPGAATGKVVFSPETAMLKKEAGEKVILVRIETSADDLNGMDAAEGILTARGGMTSHAAVVARGMGKCCIAGAGEMYIDYRAHEFRVGDKIIKEGDWISLDGSIGEVYEGEIATRTPELSGDFADLMDLTDKYARLKVRTNADTPETAVMAREFGAVGIGLCRTEHMFFQNGRIMAVREMIMANDEAGRRKALDKLLPMQRSDFEKIFEAMQNLPVTIRLIDPPLHEFMPYEEEHQQELAQQMAISIEEVKSKMEQLEEVNPMLGHRGCRLGNTYPEITEIQVRAIIEAALNLKKRGVKALPEIMVPLTGTLGEMQLQEQIIRKEAEKVFEEKDDRIDYLVGTMIEVPRAVIIADKLAGSAEFFSFGTNDLTQLTYGYSRDDAGKFLPVYINKGLLPNDPFQVLDQEGVGSLVKMGVELGRQTRPDIKLGICGEHGGEPSSVKFCHSLRLDYVSCSPFRVPVARLAAAQAAIEEKNK